MEIEPNKNYLLYYTKYHPFIGTNIKNNIDNVSLELNEDENDNNNNNNIINGRWSQKEHLLFIKGCLLFGNCWKEVQNYIQTRNCSQIRSHSQKYFYKLVKKYKDKIGKKLNKEEINKIVNKTKLSNKDMENAEMHILTIFKGNKEKNKENENDIKEINNIKENIINNNFNSNKKKKKIMKPLEKEKIFEITKIPKEIKIQIKKNEINEIPDSNNENEKENEEINNISNEEEEYEENNNNEKKILKKDILADKEDTEIISQKEEFINKCLDSKDPKDLVKLLTYFGNDINFKVTDINILKKYQYYLGLDLDGSEENIDENSKNKSEEMNNVNNSNNLNNNTNTGNAFYPYLITPSGNGVQFNPVFNPKIILHPQIISQS